MTFCYCVIVTIGVSCILFQRYCPTYIGQFFSFLYTTFS